MIVAGRFFVEQLEPMPTGNGRSSNGNDNDDSSTLTCMRSDYHVF